MLFQKTGSLSKDNIPQLPENITPVYWDYYKFNKSDYIHNINQHRLIAKEPVMASGIWTWDKVWYDHDITVKTIFPCIEACIETKVTKIFFTMWRDDGAFCDFDSAFLGLVYCSEKAYSGSIKTKRIQSIFSAICGGELNEVMCASKMESIARPAKLIWDDPLYGIYLTHIEKYNPNYSIN